jgi:hypothetical protein
MEHLDYKGSDSHPKIVFLAPKWNKKRIFQNQNCLRLVTSKSIDAKGKKS